MDEPEIDTIFEAGSAEEIWRLIDKEAIDVITLDMTMPGIDGLQIIRRLKSQSRSDIIVLSGNADSHPQAMRLGAVACFEKDRLMRTARSSSAASSARAASCTDRLFYAD